MDPRASRATPVVAVNQTLPAASSLALVDCGLLRAVPQLVPLRHVTALFTQLLDASVLVSLPKAAASGSVRLFSRVADRYAVDAGLDRGQRNFWFARAMQVALEKDDLVMLQRIHALHPEPLYLYVPAVVGILYTNALGLAFKYGSLETIQWLLEHRADRACCRPGIATFCRACVIESLRSIGDRDVFRIVMWLFECGVLRTTNAVRLLNSDLWVPTHKSPVLVQWLAAQKLLTHDRAIGLLMAAVRQRRVANALTLLDILAGQSIETSVVKQCLLHASFGGLDDVVAKFVSLGLCDSFQGEFVLAPAVPGGTMLVQWRADLMNEQVSQFDAPVAGICREAALRAGNLVALQWLYHARGVLPNVYVLASDVADEATLLAICQWMHDAQIPLPTALMDGVAGRGFLTVVQWLHAHSSAGCTTAAMDNAAAHGHLEVVMWLQEHRSEGCSSEAVNSAAEHGHLTVVQWLFDHRRWQLDLKRAMCFAAVYGQLEVLIWLASVNPEATCTRCIANNVFKGTGIRLTSCKSIDVLRWNDAQPTVLCASCRAGNHRLSGAMISLAYEGDLDVLTYLYQMHREQLHFADPMEVARRVAQGGHLGVLQWIYQTFGAESVRHEDARHAEAWYDDWTYVIEEAEEFGHDHILTWVRSLEATEA